MAGLTVVTKAELARRIGRSPARISQLIAAGRLGPPALLENGSVDLDAALAQLAPFLEEDRAGAVSAAPKPAVPSPMADARLRLALAQAAKAEADLEAARGQHRREATLLLVAAAESLASIVIEMMDARREGLVLAVLAAPGTVEAVAAAKEADLTFRRGFAAAAEAHAVRAGMWPNVDEFRAARQLAFAEVETARGRP